LLAIWHRRAGKDEIVMNGMASLAHAEIGTYWHVFPQYAQARKAIWNGINMRTGQRRIFDAFHPSEIERMSDNDMFIELKSGSTYQLLGSDRYDATVGSGPRGVAYSEWALSNPASWGYHAPMINETKGWAAFITTPRGTNHAKTMYDLAQKSDRWFSEILSVEDTGALTPEEITAVTEEYVGLHGDDLGLALFQQEYMCSWSGATIGSYWAAEVSRAEREGRIAPFEIADAPVHTAWDLGNSSETNPIWCFQVIGGQPVIVDFYQPSTDDLADWIAWLNAKGYKGNDYVPHDIMVTEWGNNRTRFDILRDMGRKPVRVARVSVADGLQAGRVTINAAKFRDTERINRGLDGLRSYRREWDEILKTYKERPVKDWAEHVGSSFRYLALAWRTVAPPVEKALPPAKELVYEANADGTLRANMDVREWVRIKEKQRGRRSSRR